MQFLRRLFNRFREGGKERAFPFPSYYETIPCDSPEVKEFLKKYPTLKSEFEEYINELVPPMAEALKLPLQTVQKKLAPYKRVIVKRRRDFLCYSDPDNRIIALSEGQILLYKEFGMLFGSQYLLPLDDPPRQSINEADLILRFKILLDSVTEKEEISYAPVVVASHLSEYQNKATSLLLRGVERFMVGHELAHILLHRNFQDYAPYNGALSLLDSHDWSSGLDELFKSSDWRNQWAEEIAADWLSIHTLVNYGMTQLINGKNLQASFIIPAHCMAGARFFFLVQEIKDAFAPQLSPEASHPLPGVRWAFLRDTLVKNYKSVGLGDTDGSKVRIVNLWFSLLQGLEQFAAQILSGLGCEHVSINLVQTHLLTDKGATYK